MRRSIFLLAFMLPIVMVAQTKIAVYNSQEVFSAMPDKAQAEARLKATSDRLQAEYKQIQTEFNKKYAEYQAIATDANTPAAIRDRRIQEVQEGDRRIQAFQQQAAEELNNQEQILMEPIHAAILAAVKEVGEEVGYDLILDLSKTPVDYLGSGVTNITQQVKQKLGL